MMSLGVLDEGTACLGCGMGDHTEDAILDTSGLVPCSTTELTEFVV
jgi:hypothetical protein